MEQTIEAAGAILLIVAWAVALWSFGRYLPRSIQELRRARHSLTDWLNHHCPGIHAEIRNAWRTLHRELRGFLPVFSAQSTGNLEAEFIRDPLPGRFPFWIALLALVALIGLAWWIGR